MCCKAALLLLSLIVSFSFGACSEKTQYEKIQLKAEGQIVYTTTSNSTKAPLRVGIAAVISPKETLRSYKELLDYLSAKLERPVEIIQRKTYAEMNDLIRSGNVDLAFVCTQAYVEGQMEFGLETLVVPQVRGQTEYYSYVIVPEDSEVQVFEQLRGKMFAFTDPMSNSGRLAPAYLLADLGETPESYFKKVVFTYSHDNSIKAVAEKLVDGAAVDSLVYDYDAVRSPQYTSRTRIIKKLGPYATPPAVVHPRLDPSLKTQLSDILLSMHGDVQGAKILNDLLIDRFVVPEDRQYDSVREMLTRLRNQ